MFVRFIRVRHLAQGGGSIGNGGCSVIDEVMWLTSIRRELKLSVTGYYQGKTVMKKRKSGKPFSSVREPT